MPNGNKTVIYTAIFGNRDELKDPRVIEHGVDYICFSDKAWKSDIWKVVVCGIPTESDYDPCRKAKMYKIQPHLFLKQYDRSIWIDGNVELMNPITSLFNEMSCDLGFFKHPYPNEICVYREASQCIRQQYDDVDLILKTISKCKRERHPENWGLPMGRVIFRQHSHRITCFNGNWWREIENGTRRDQISLPLILRRSAIPYNEFNPYRLYNIKDMNKWHPTQLIKLHLHNKKGLFK